MSQEPLRLLLLDGTRSWVKPLLPSLQASGFALSRCRHVDDARQCLEQQPVDLVVVDLAAGQRSGATLAAWMRSHPPGLPLLAVGPQLREPLRVELLETWADDVLTLPLALPEFAARCRALWRRSQLRLHQGRIQASETWLRHGAVEMLVEEHRVWCGGAPVELTPREFRLLEYLLRHPGCVLDRDTLLEQVWGEFSSLELDPKTVDVHIRWLRLKLETNAAAPTLITTVRGRGYRLA